MQSRRDPIQRAADEERDLYGIATWEPRSRVDRVFVALDGAARVAVRLLLYAVAGVIGAGVLSFSAVVLYAQFDRGPLGAITDPVVSALVVLSVVPALLLVGYVWYADVTTDEPLSLLVATFLLAVLLAGIAAVLNDAGRALLDVRRGTVTIGLFVFFYAVVGPVEEAVKLLAVRLAAYRSERFDAVVDGAVYGAVAGLGFATIENALYITMPLASVPAATGVFEATSSTAAARSLAGPGHVIYSSIAGFYLGLAKFNREYAVPLVLKGLAIAAVVHGTYNVGATTVPPTVRAVAPVGTIGAVLAYVVVFDAVVGYYLYRLLGRYRDTYEAVGAARGGERMPAPELVEFDSPPADRRSAAERTSREGSEALATAHDDEAAGDLVTDDGEETARTLAAGGENADGNLASSAADGAPSGSADGAGEPHRADDAATERRSGSAPDESESAVSTSPEAEGWEFGRIESDGPVRNERVEDPEE